MHCKKCGAKIREGAAFCHKCGVKIVYEYDEPQEPDNIKKEMSSSKSDSEIRQKDEGLDQIAASESSFERDSFNEKDESEFEEWWSRCSKVKRILVVLGALLVCGVVLYALVVFLRKFGSLLFGIAVIGGFIVKLTTGTEKEKRETRKTIVQIVAWIVVICIVSYIIVFKPDIIRPGVSVRNAYLSQYSESVTIEDAFEKFFENGKWSTYKEEDYSYVVFTGVCEYLGERADVRMTFKITGENFIIDTLDINGQTQNNVILYSLLSTIYEDY